MPFSGEVQLDSGATHTAAPSRLRSNLLACAHAPASLEVLAGSSRGERRLLVPLSHGCGSAASPADCLRETAVPMLRRPHLWILGLPFHQHFDVTFHAGRGSPQAGTAPLQLLFRAVSGAARRGPTSERVE